MRTEFLKEPRKYTWKDVTISDMGRVYLEADQQVTFVTPSGKECDFAAKSWGFYLGPSVNGRLVQQGFKTCLAHNPEGRLFVHAVEKERVEDFMDYLHSQKGTLVCWLDEWLEPTY